MRKPNISTAYNQTTISGLVNGNTDSVDNQDNIVNEVGLLLQSGELSILCMHKRLLSIKTVVVISGDTGGNFHEQIAVGFVGIQVHHGNQPLQHPSATMFEELD